MLLELAFWNVQVPQGSAVFLHSVETHYRCSGKSYNIYLYSFLGNLPVKHYFKSYEQKLRVSVLGSSVLRYKHVS